MALTPRFGLTYFGGDVEGGFNSDGQKYTLNDRLAVDRILAALESHDHSVRPASPEPIGAPTLSLITDGGLLEAGRTYRYAISFVDEDGLESVIGEIASVTTPQPLPQPDPPQLETATVEGATLATGLYFYAITALRADEESILSSPVSATMITGDNAMIVTLPTEDIGATGYRVWRMGSTESGYTAIGTTSGPTFTDDGSVPPDPCACDPEKQPPTTNSGVDTYGVTIALNGADAAVATERLIRSWRIYRSEDEGVFPSQSLVEEVTTTVDPENPDAALVTSWVDDGGALVTGAPQLVSQNLAFTPITLPYAEALPGNAGLYPNNYPMLVGTTLYVARDGAWQAISAAGGGAGTQWYVAGSFASVTDPQTGDKFTYSDSGEFPGRTYEWDGTQWVFVLDLRPQGTTGAAWPNYVFTSPNGNRWLVSVDDTGALVTTQTDLPGGPTPPQNLA